MEIYISGKHQKSIATKLKTNKKNIRNYQKLFGPQHNSNILNFVLDGLNVEFIEKLVDTKDLQLYGALKWESVQKSGLVDP